MSDSESFEKPKRRPRYAGRNPRAFHEKYKEHQPERYADDVAKVLAGGRTPAGMHRPIMVREIIERLAPKPGDIAVDCTLGYGGHARELLAAIQPGGRLLAVDADPIELPKTEARLRALGFPQESFVARRMNFAGLPQFVFSEAPAGVDVLLADLGLSSMQIDDPRRGFSFKSDGPLDMRMNVEHGQPASSLLGKLGAEELAEILVANADVVHAERVASAIVQAQSTLPLMSTQALSAVVRQSMERLSSDAEVVTNTVRGVFQALRIEVNDEFGALATLLRNLPGLVKSGGRIAILTFHSGEDRRVKQAFKQGLEAGIYASVTKDVLRPTWDEQQSNPRSSSAKLRVAVRS